MVLARSHDARVLVERKGDVGLEGQAGVFQDDLGGSLFPIVSILCVLDPSVCCA